MPTRIVLMPEVEEDFERILSHLVEHGSEHGAQRIGEIVTALDILAFNPELGRPAHAGFRELVIGRRRQGGYLALYRYLEEADTAFVVAIRSQREAGYSRSS